MHSSHLTQVTAEEERAMALFMGKEPKGKSLADIIMEKIDAKEKAENQEVVPEGLSPKVIKCYTDVAQWLKRFGLLHRYPLLC